jgi:hypothetical protein
MKQLLSWCGFVFIVMGLLVTSGCATLSRASHNPFSALLRVPEVIGESLAQAVICPAGATHKTNPNCSDKKIYW